MKKFSRTAAVLSTLVPAPAFAHGGHAETFWLAHGVVHSVPLALAAVTLVAAVLLHRLSR